MLYDRTNLPTFKANTAGVMKPKPGADVAVCIAPSNATIIRPASWGPGAALEISAGVHHIAQDVAGDSYPNAEFPIFYRVLKELDPATDPRAAYLKGFWAAMNHDVKVQLATKTKNAICLGEVTDEMEESVFETTEGKVVLRKGTRILQSPDNPEFVWAVEQRVYAKKYAEGGKIYTR